MPNEEEKTKETEVLEVSNVTWQIPICCQESWDSCPHVVKREKMKKNNVGL